MKERIPSVISPSSTVCVPAIDRGVDRLLKWKEAQIRFTACGVLCASVRFLTGREEVVDGSGDIERRQLQTLGQAVEGVALDSGRFIRPSSEQNVLNKELVRQKAGELWVLTLLWIPLGLLQQNHHHIHREQPGHHLSA